MWLVYGLGILIYFVPTLVGMSKKDNVGIFILNLLLGWTVLGWIGALIWAVSSPDKGVQYQCPKCGYVHALNQEVKIFVCPQCKNEANVNN